MEQCRHLFFSLSTPGISALGLGHDSSRCSQITLLWDLSVETKRRGIGPVESTAKYCNSRRINPVCIQGEIQDMFPARP